MDELEPCLADRTGAGCAELHDEISDVDSFRSLLRFFLNSEINDDGSGSTLSASALLVGLHNIVTSAVSPDFGGLARHKFYCANEVLDKLSQSLVPEAKQVVVALPQNLKDKVPGFGAHRLWNCTQ